VRARDQTRDDLARDPADDEDAEGESEAFGDGDVRLEGDGISIAID
jgi:hypothetical protein